MGSRIREKPDHLFEVFVEIASSQGDEKGPFILQQFPEDYEDKEALAMMPKFAYPCETDASQVDHFTFVLTDVESRFRFGYCRHATGHQTCLCIVSCLPWCEVFFKLLDTLSSITNNPDHGNSITDFLQTTYNYEVPLPNIPVTIVAGENMFNFTSPDPNVLPSIPKSRNLTEYYNAVDTQNMMRIFASMVQERRIYMTSKKLSRLTACIHAAEALLYPMHWQHLYIPVLPAHLIDYISAPMPYLIGVHSNLVEKLRINRVDVADAVIVDLDTNTVTSEYNDLECLPEDVQNYLKKSLKTDVVRNSMTKNGDAISVAFLQTLVRLIGGYREALKIRPEEPITFDPEVFVRSRPSQVMQDYLEGMLTLQIFQQFICGRLEILNSGVGFTDIFEQQATAYTDKLNSQSNYKEWLKSVKNSGRRGKEVLSGLKVKAAPMMSGAVNSVKSQGKKAFADMRTKISNMTDNEDKRGSGFQVSGGRVHSKVVKSHSSSVARSITEDQRPKRPPRPPPPAGGSSEGRNSGLLKEDSQDDSQLRLSYHTVDVSLMADQDIQAAMMRSASAEVLPKNGPENWSGSTSTISSDSRSVDDTDSANIPFGSLQSSDDESQSSLVDVPSVGYKSQSSTSGYSTTSSDFVTGDRLILKKKQNPAVAPTSPASRPSQQQTTPPPPLPTRSSAFMTSKPPVIPPRAPNSQSPSPTPTAQPLRPPPRRPNASRQPISQQQQSNNNNVTQQEALLIKFESSESEATDSEVFDPLVLSKNSSLCQNPIQSDGIDSLDGLADITMRDNSDKGNALENKSFQRSSSSRSSLSRSKAFRRESTNKLPLRKGSSFADDECDDDDDNICIGNDNKHDDKDAMSVPQDPTTAIFDPLTSSSLSIATSNTVAADSSKISPGMTAPVSSRPRRDSSADLMKHEWSLTFLSTGPQIRLPRSGGLNLKQQQSHGASHQLPRQSTLPANPAFAMQQQLRAVPPSGPLVHQSSLHSTSSSPGAVRYNMGLAQQPVQTAPYRSRPFSNSPQASSPFQFIGAPHGSPNTPGSQLQSSTSQQQQLFPSSSLPLSSNNKPNSRSPSSSPKVTRQNVDLPSSSKPSAFSSTQSSFTPSHFSNSSKSTPMQPQHSNKTSLNNFPSKQRGSTAAAAMTQTSSSGKADPFGDLLDIQFGGGQDIASNKQQPLCQKKDGQTQNASNQNPSKPSQPPPLRWETFE